MRQFFGHINVFDRPGYNPTGERYRLHVYPRGTKKFACTDVWRPIEVNADTLPELFAKARSILTK